MGVMADGGSVLMASRIQCRTHSCRNNASLQQTMGEENIQTEVYMVEGGTK